MPIGDGTQGRQNSQHAMDAALGVWTRRPGHFENFDGWTIEKQRNGRWLVCQPGGAFLDADKEQWVSEFPSATWAKAAAENRIAGVC